MKIQLVILILSLCCIKTTVGQNNIYIEGKILDKETKEPIPFANIYNKSAKKGTISNMDGYFRLGIDAYTDTITISYIGYKEQVIKVKAEKINYLIFLESNTLILSEIIVSPEDPSYLIELIRKCKKSAPKTEKKSKAYYELKSYVDGNQIELVEGYYNIDVKGYLLKALNMKAGRIALRPYHNHFFASLESSRALLMHNIFEHNNYFPTNPIELPTSKIKKKFHLNLGNKYCDINNDSVFIIEYKPKDTTGVFFDGKIWINKSKNQIIKIIMTCDNAIKHPFLPIYSSDKIKNVSFTISQSFQPINNEITFNHLEFMYTIDYQSRLGKPEEENYTIKTKAVLYAYDYDQLFILPFFDFKTPDIGEYRKINALPFNQFFWKHNDEYRLNDSSNTNELFFSDSNSFTNKTLFKPNYISKNGLFEHPYISWSKNRIRFREIVKDTSLVVAAGSINAEQYKIAVKLFLDINSYGDSTNIITSTIIDPYDSFYHLPMDNQTHCFVNIYFDLFEIERQEFEKKLKQLKSDFHQINQLYKLFLLQMDQKSSIYFKAVDRGTNENEMRKYNKIVIEKLGIDNIEIFHPYEKEK